MTYYSFEKYMDSAISIENDPAAEASGAPASQQLILEVPGTQLGGLTLGQEAQIVAGALIVSDIYTDKLAGEKGMLGEEENFLAATAGWDLTVFTPNPQYRPRAINREVKNYASFVEPIMLGENGKLYCVGPNIDPLRPLKGEPLLAETIRGTYDPEAGLDENNERVRYGLARLVARHELELPA